MLRLAAAFAKAIILLFVTVYATFSYALDFPVRGNEKISISVPEAVINLQATASSNQLRINLTEGAAEDYMVNMENGTFVIRTKEPATKESFGQWTPKKRVIEIQGPALPVEIHIFEGQVQLTKWSREALVHVQKGRIVSRDGTASLTAHSQNGEILVQNHQGRLDVDAYKSNITVRDLNGDADVENFAGETTVDKAKGYLSLNQGTGSTKVTGSSGTLQYELTKGNLSIQTFQGRVEGQSQEGPVVVTMAADSEISLKSQSGRVTVNTPKDSGASLNLVTQEGEISAPNTLKVNRDGGQKSLRGHLKGEQKGSVFVRSQEGSIFIR